jgi:NAD(P)H-flavin reductase
MNKIYSFQAKLLEKIQLNENDFKLKYQAPDGFLFTPGQFVSIKVIPTHSRAYSIVDVQNNVIELLIDIKPGGIASQYFAKTQVGDEVQMSGPFGIYGIKGTLPNKVFICTGTGVAPFIPMARSSSSGNANVKILFGTRTDSNDIAYDYFKDLISQNFEYFQCVSREEPTKPYAVKGHVTDCLTQLFAENKIDLINTEFYICGAKQMIDDTVAIIKSHGGDKIYFEKYG